MVVKVVALSARAGGNMTSATGEAVVPDWAPEAGYVETDSSLVPLLHSP